MADRLIVRSQSISSSHSSCPNKPLKVPDINKAPQSTVTCVYQAPIAGYCRNVTVLWTKNLTNYSLSLLVDSMEGDVVCTCKIDLKPWHFWAKKGYKIFEVDRCQIEVYWDLRSAKFSGSPEPCSDYYVALISEDEVVLLLGDLKKKVYKRTKARPSLVDATLYYKKENVFGKKSFSTRARFDQMKQEHDIVVESSGMGPRDPELWITIDGVMMIHVTNLQWKFRGNENFVVDQQPVQVYWDVHAWLFDIPGSSHGLFIFKSGDQQGESTNEETSGHCDDTEFSSSSQSSSKNSEFCLFLYAWKVE